MAPSLINALPRPVVELLDEARLAPPERVKDAAKPVV